MKLLGPFSQIISMRGLPSAGPIGASQLEVIENGGVLVEGDHIKDVGGYNELRSQADVFEEIIEPSVLMPGLIDAHTHICFAGSRAGDYMRRLEGESYLDISASGGGIMSTVRHTRDADKAQLIDGILSRCKRLIGDGITTCEVKSGYGLSLEAEVKMLEAIAEANTKSPVTLVATCLAAHVCPPEFNSQIDYINHLVNDLLPEVVRRNLAKRADIFVERSAFGSESATKYLLTCKQLGLDVVIHADQFTIEGSHLAAEHQVLSADHLEVSDEPSIRAMAKSGVIGVVLPGATLGLGQHFAPARKMLDNGMCVVIASDWNPGSAPMGDLLTQAAVLGAAEKLTMAETLAGMTERAARALRLADRGILTTGKRADMISFPTNDYREILYHQGSMKPNRVWVDGKSY
ncbi:MAG: imidazolonepropionase [Flavobacteriales bacterium]|nr:imidazolonepropionase [Flavobacteriales bacterium]